MSLFDELDRYVAPFCDSEPGDFWHDFAVEHAMKILGRFSADEYAQLREAIPHRSDEWIIRVCETAEAGQPDQVMDILLSLLENTNSRVVSASLEGIRSIVQGGFECARHAAKIEEAIDRVLPESGSVWGIALAELRRLLSGGAQRGDGKTHG